MNDFFQWLSNGSISSTVFMILFGVLVVGFLLIYVIAFFQGREVTFWPPKIGEKPDKLLQQVSDDVKTLMDKASQNPSHLRYHRDRSDFNEIGIEILNGTVAYDTVYIVLRSGTFIGDFAKALAKFRSHTGTKLIVIVPNKEVFLSNFGGALQTWITELYENPVCAGVRGLILEPGMTQPSEVRMRGYWFISDGHVHEDDDGFYTNTAYSAKFLLNYFKLLIQTGTPVSLPRTKIKTSD